MRRMHSRRRSGFTIVELLVVVAVIGILATIVLIGFNRYQADTRDSERSSEATIIAEALEKYYDKNGEYPGCTTMTGSASTVTSTLTGINPSVLVTPQATSGQTNSIDFCTDITTSTAGDNIAYVGDGSSTCLTGSSCLQFKLEYKSETNGTIQTITSRRTTNITTSGTIANLSGTANQFSSVSLSWGAISNASTYTVQAALNSSFSSIIATMTPSTNSTSFTGLTPGTSYWFRVAANAPNSQTGWSNTVALTVPHIATPGSPTAAYDNTNTTSQLNFSWASVSGATSYTVNYSSSSTFASGVTTVTGITGTSTSVTGLAPGTMLYFQVKALAPDDTSSYTTTASATTVVPVPTGNAVAAQSSTSYKQTWSAVTGAASYTVQCSLDNATWGTSCYGTSQATTTATTYTYTGAYQGQKYYVRVEATAVSGINSSWSSSVSVILSIDTPAVPVMAVDSHSWANNSVHNVNYYSYCPAGTSLSIGPSFAGGWESSGFNWSDGINYFHAWGFNDYWNRGSPYGAGSQVIYNTNYYCYTAYTSSPYSPTSTDYIAVY